MSKPDFTNPITRMRFKLLVNEAVKLQIEKWNTFGSIEELLGMDVENLDEKIDYIASGDGELDDVHLDEFFNDLDFI
jgi:hypothetical protein